MVIMRRSSCSAAFNIFSATLVELPHVYWTDESASILGSRETLAIERVAVILGYPIVTTIGRCHAVCDRIPHKSEATRQEIILKDPTYHVVGGPAEAVMPRNSMDWTGSC